MDTAALIGVATLFLSAVIAAANAIGARANNHRFEQLKDALADEFTAIKERLARVETALALGHAASPTSRHNRRKS